MNRDRIPAGVSAEREQFNSQVNEIAQALRVDLLCLLDQFGNLTRQSGVSSSRLGARVGPALASLQSTLKRLEDMVETDASDSKTCARPAKTLSVDSRPGVKNESLVSPRKTTRKHSALEIY